ncbi:Ion-translocating oxidoreductase complex subunit G [Candidatus Erwinia haradaeae]|uniref:Ion-translocating oxidoreductase complex subunit G n=1 Tax=Candidatus Erwinia haradaeae TaxID=1922217 RepID=A0A451DBY4_9GAMM|nr:electron transport complex subunit RsxG [Candidatus Erwinia haradaeae]VFP83920.1 Ion-translocating oxidoreductase complex subunit G [Candidatus Erwinia haradaeae]
MLDVIKKNSITLAIFAAITTGLTAIIHVVTQPDIQLQMTLKQQNILNEVIPPILYNNNIQSSCYSVSNPALGDTEKHRLYVAKKDNKPIAIAIETTAPDGYAGNIQIIIGANFDGLIYGIRVVEHHETPGLGDKIELRLSNWVNSFQNQKIISSNLDEFAVKKDGGHFDQFTGATITPRAVVNAVKRTVLYIQTLQKTLAALPLYNMSDK